MTSKRKSNTRIYWVDALKAIGIFLVVFGHTIGIGEGIREYIFTFHVPLFFFVSGFLLKKKHLHANYTSFLIKKGKPLIIPYFFFSILSYLFWLAFLRKHGMYASVVIVEPLHPLIGMFYGIGVNDWSIHNVPLWFLPCLFLTHAVFFWIARSGSKPLMFFLIFISSISGHLILQYLNFRLPWGLEIALVATAFYGTGFLLQDIRLINKKPGLRYVLPLVIVCIVMQLIVVQHNDYVDMNSGMFGNIFLFYVGAAFGIFLCVLIAKTLPYLKFISEIGKNTLVIFSLHIRVFSILTGIIVIILKIPISFIENSLLTAISYAIVTTGVLTSVGNFMRLHMPWALGLR